MALINDQMDVEFAATIRALEPYSRDIVFIGGCANALYRFHDLAGAAPSPIGTLDVDIACAPPIDSAGREPIADLLSAAGFVADYHSEHSPPIMKFRSTRDENVDIEILSPLTGSAVDRKGNPKVTEDVQPQTSAVRLRYLDLLLYEPWRIPVGHIPALGMPKSKLEISVPNPVAYMMQKVLIMSGEGRRSADIDKDCYYIYEVSLLFRKQASALAQHAASLAKEWPKWFGRFKKTLGREFDTPELRGSVAAVRVRRDSGLGDIPTEEIVSRVVSGFGALLAG